MLLAGMKFVIGRYLPLLVISLFIAGCYSQRGFAAHNEMRRQQLLEMYPIRKTTQKDVAKRWGHPPSRKTNQAQSRVGKSS